MTRTILLVDDDPLLRRSLAFNLEQQGYQVQTAGSAEDGLALARKSSPDLVLLDIGLPGMDGLEALRFFKQQLNIPVIFLTARRRDFDEILGLDLGADDYITKPITVDLLAAHIKAVLRRAALAAPPAFRLAPVVVDDLAIDPAAHTLTLGGKPISLTPREFDLLYVLASEAGKVVPLDQLLTRVWGAEFTGEPQVLYVHIRWLREKIEENPEHPQRLLTVHGVGYKLQPRASHA